MPGYASNQFWNFGSTYEVGKTLSRKKDDNPNFIFPRPQQPDVYNNIRGRQNVDTRMQRGFIRGIYQTVGAAADPTMLGKIKQRRLFFQFNPATIDRSVEMNAMVANPLLQDPSQIFQPVAGTAAFSFDLTFNREAEVVAAQNASTRMSSTGRWQTDTANPITSSLDAYGENTSHSDVASLGVLADLYVLDSIIGQSITPDTKDFIKAYFETADLANAANATVQNSTTVTNADGSTTLTETKSDGTIVTTVTDTKGKKTVTTGTSGDSAANFDSTGFETNITKNYGNGAFLSPMPIRIVFSSLFMVEGYVEASSVRFAKFTKNYVPTVCAVTLTVRALYIGFAKEEAYLTSALKTAVKDVVAERKQGEAELALSQNAAEWGTNFLYKSCSIQKLIKQTATSNYTNGLYVHDYDTFYDFWNDGRWPAGGAKASGGGLITFNNSSGGAGRETTLVRSYASEIVRKRIQDSEFTWTFDARFMLEEYLPDKKTKVQTLLDTNIKYARYNTSNGATGGDEVTTQEVANFTNAKKSIADSRRTDYVIEVPNGGNQSGMPMFKDSKNIVKLTITHTNQFSAKLSSGDIKNGVGVMSYSTFITKTKKTSPGTGLSWEELDKQGVEYTLPVGTNPVTYGGRRSTPN
jgi:hypothetical protein